MEFSKLVEEVKSLNQDNGGDWDPVWQLAWILEELGEVSKELIKLQKLSGRFNPNKNTSALSIELGDVLYGLISLANSYEIDLQTSLENTITKFRNRKKNRS
ncbi:MAG: hypothetical protein INQ03_00640 [Candidatus Heimdallarchaeota archaeon]|nr:hypothetical protein [Candidatus Heimdallarchaeota archaeon]